MAIYRKPGFQESQKKLREELKKILNPKTSKPKKKEDKKEETK